MESEHILGAFVGRDNGSKYCTIEMRDRESVYALAAMCRATSTSSEATGRSGGATGRMRVRIGERCE